MIMINYHHHHHHHHRMGSQNFGDAVDPPPWDGYVADPHDASHLCYRAKFGHSMSNRSSVIMKICHKIWPLTPVLSRSLKVIGIDAVRSATCDFLSVFRSKYSPISDRFRDKGDICKIFSPLVFNVPAQGALNDVHLVSRVTL